MRRFALFCFVVAVAAVVPEPSEVYLYFVQQLTASMCDTGPACVEKLLKPGAVADGFTVHGLWPNFQKGGYPQFCDETYPYSEKELSSIESDLQYYWPSLPSGDYNSFWNHEWSKHGTCALKIWSSEAEYFNAILNLRKKIDLVNLLGKAGIVEDASKLYQPQAISDAVKEGLGQPLVISCSKTDSGQAQLHEVGLCYSHNMEIMDCPKFVMDGQFKNCGSDGILMPKLPTQIATESIDQPAIVDVAVGVSLDTAPSGQTVGITVGAVVLSVVALAMLGLVLRRRRCRSLSPDDQALESPLVV